MSVSEKKLAPQRITFWSACRENTGSSMCDSGGAYGRQHQLPEITRNKTAAVIWRTGESPTISTPHYLDAFLKIDRALMTRCARYGVKNPDMDWFELGRTFCEEQLGLVLATRDNVYNRENDLSQVFVYEVWQRPEQVGEEYIYRDHCELVTVFCHTGCDARGGYGRPLFCRPKGEYSIPLDICAGFSAVTGATAEGELLSGHALQTLDEKWSDGYSSYPFCQLEKDVAEWYNDTRTIDTVAVTLKTGERVQVQAYMETHDGT